MLPWLVSIFMMRHALSILGGSHNLSVASITSLEKVEEGRQLRMRTSSVRYDLSICNAMFVDLFNSFFSHVR